MKKNLQSMLSLILSLLLVFSLASCNEPANTTGANACTEHQWLAANCTHPQTCLSCGETEGSYRAGAHAYTQDGETYTCVFRGDIQTVSGECTHVAGADTCPLCGRTGLNIIKNVIYIIGDGMGLEHIAAGQMAYNKDYCFDEWQFASVNTDSLTSGGRNQSELTDSAAAGTALATGTVTLNEHVGKDQNGNDLTTILDYAKSRGMKTGLITTDKLYGATPGAFSAHSLDRDNYMEILESQIDSGIDLICGSTTSSDALETSLITSKGYQHCTTFSAMKYSKASKLYCTLKMEGSYASDVSLADATVASLNFLDNEKGFALVIEQAHVDKSSHNKDVLGAVYAVNSLNNTVEAILDWLGDRTDTAIVITSDHETGDFSVSATKTLPESASVGDGYPTFYYRFNSGSHTKSNVGLFIYGADINIKAISYFKTEFNVKNSDIFTIVKMLIQNRR